MKYVIQTISFVYLCFVLSSPIGCTESKSKTAQETLLKPNKIERESLPIKIEDSTWQIFEDVQSVEYLEIEYDYTRKNGSVSENVSAQYWVLPSEYRHGISIYTKNVEESVLIHEALHAKLMVLGYPFFYRVRFPEHKSIANLENEIQHFIISKAMSTIGVDSKKNDIASWITGAKIMDLEISKIPSSAPKYVLNLMGATSTLAGLNRGITNEEILGRLPQRLQGGFPLGVNIYNKLLETKMLDMEDNFRFHIWLALVLDLSSKDTVIGRIDFKNRNRKFYDPRDGKLLEIKR